MPYLYVPNESTVGLCQEAIVSRGPLSVNVGVLYEK